MSKITSAPKVMTTPRPWKYSAESGDIYYDDATEIHPRVAMVDLDNLADPAQGNADGELIVRAVNCHDEAREALQEAENGLAELCQGQCGENECWQVLLRVRAALAKMCAP